MRGGDGADVLVGGDANDKLWGGADADMLSGDAGNDKLYGEAGDDDLDGGAGKDDLTGGAGDDELTGGAQADVFIFGAGDGNDTITDFEDGSDLIDLTALGLSGMDALGLAQVGTDVVITLAPGDSVTVENIGLTQLTADDFVF